MILRTSLSFFLFANFLIFLTEGENLDDARTELEKLRATVMGAIFAADNNLEDLNSDLKSYSRTTQSTAMYSLLNEEKRVTASIDAIKRIASQAGADISECLLDREENLHNLRSVINEKLGVCLLQEIEQASEVLTASKYLIDISITKVNALEFQLGLCSSDSESCLSVIVNQIKLAEEKLPEEIKVEVVKATDLFDKIRVSLKACSNLSVSEYVLTADTIFREITACMGPILGS